MIKLKMSRGGAFQSKLKLKGYSLYIFKEKNKTHLSFFLFRKLHFHKNHKTILYIYIFFVFCFCFCLQGCRDQKPYPTLIETHFHSQSSCVLCCCLGIDRVTLLGHL